MEQWQPIIILAAVILVFFLLGLAERRRFLARVKQELRERYGHLQERRISPSRMECVPAYFRKHAGDASIDDITWSDLEMDRLFTAMNLTYSSAGEEVLYHTLRTPLYEEDALKERDAQIRYFMEHDADREALQMLFAGMGKNERYSLYDYLDFAYTLEGEAGLKYHFLAPLLLAAAVFLLFLKTEIGIVALIVPVVVNIFWYFKTKEKVQPYIVTLKLVMGDLKAGRAVLKKELTACGAIKEQLKTALAEMKHFTNGAGFLFYTDASNGDPAGLVADYINMVLHIDMIVFYYLYRQMQAHREAIDRVHTSLGYLEMLIAAGSFQAALDAHCRPVFDGVEAAAEIYHPLIEAPVKNSYRLKGCMLLTGSNASGKSTFLKTLALNQLLAQTLYMACAEEFHTDFHRIYTSMALRDDLAHQESYFMVEIRAMQRILNAGQKKGARIACCVDEVLRGTNTVERIAASAEILKHMAAAGYFCAAATHDIELTALLEDCYENFHFTEEIRDGDVIFSYKLLQGKATTRNAIRLLSVMGYQEGLVQSAEALAEHFLQAGQWQ
ncbi:MAG: hypothetical protein IJ600_05305 [Lachnospiraceae bacterium]|nr:hypothetical protein [Lachnospiraceae bacterium]